MVSHRALDLARLLARSFNLPKAVTDLLLDAVLSLGSQFGSDEVGDER